jgi:hypothetical protein
VEFNETVILGKDRGFMTVRYLVMRGPNFEIGRKLGEIAMERYGLNRDSIFSADPLVTRARRNYFVLNYPVMLERSRGAAYALGVNPVDDDYDPTQLPYNLSMPSTFPPAECSVVYYPPQTTASGHGLLSRNYDFPKGSLADFLGIQVPADVKREMRPMMAEPYTIEIYPEDGGYASLCLTCFDLLSGVLDGVNSQGLAVCVNGDEVAMARGCEPNTRGVGLNELQAMRLLLDTCSTAEDAKETLLANKHFYSFIPCHYLVADRHGKAFVYEHSHGRNTEHFIEAADRPLILTNHPLYVYQSIADFPDRTGPIEAGTTSFERYMKLVDLITDAQPPYNFDVIKGINSAVSVSQVVSWVAEDQREQYASSPGLARTLWHSIYDCDARSLDVKFYVGEKVSGGGNFTEQYSEYFYFVLEA